MIELEVAFAIVQQLNGRAQSHKSAQVETPVAFNPILCVVARFTLIRGWFAIDCGNTQLVVFAAERTVPGEPDKSAIFQGQFIFEVFRGDAFATISPCVASENTILFRVTEIMGGRDGQPFCRVSVDVRSVLNARVDTTLGTFDPMYPLSQTFFGIHGLIDRRNLVSTSINSDLMLTPMLMMRLSAYSMWRAHTGDGVYRTNGAILRRPTGSEARHIGLQAQAIMGYQFNRNFLLVGAGTWMSPGDFISETQEKQPNYLWLLSLALQ